MRTIYCMSRLILGGGVLLLVGLATWIGSGATPTQAQQLPPRPTLTPQRPTELGDSHGSTSSNVLWSQSISSTHHGPDRSILSIVVRAVNVGGTDGSSDAIMYYDPLVLGLLDAVPSRPIDWVRARDDAAGTLTLAFGRLAPDEQTTMQIRFLIQEQTSSAVRLMRTDERDRANPLFLNLMKVASEPIQLTAQQPGSMLTVAGRGYKPGERLALWVNTSQDRAVAIEGIFTAMNDGDGSINLTVPLPNQIIGEVVSIVVYGRMSDAIGVAVVK